MDVQVGFQIVSAGGEAIGPVEKVLRSDASDRAGWAQVAVHGDQSALVPLHGAVVEGGDVRIAFDRDKVLGAVQFDPVEDPSHTPSLYEHYGLQVYGPPWKFP
jgi:hypothetical protein